MNILKQSTAATIKLGPFIDDGDGKSAETGLTISQADIRLSKNGGDFAQTNNAAGATHDEFGYYDIPLDTTDTNTLGRLRVAVSESGALPVWQDFLVVTANVYDTLCSTDSLDVNVTALANDVITSNAFDESSAYPLKSADTGATQVARVGADSDTLETLSDEIAAVKAETALIVADTGELQTDLVNGGRLDLLIDSIIAHLVDIKGDGWTHETLEYIGGKGANIVQLLTEDGVIINPAMGVALEATLTAIKGAGWTDETLASIQAVIEAVKAKSDQLTFTTANKVDASATIDPTGLATSAALATVDGIVDDIKAKTDQLVFTTPNRVDASATVDTTGIATSAELEAVDDKIDAIKVKTDLIPASPAEAGEYTAAIAAVKSVADDILVDTGTTLDTLVKDIPTNAELTTALGTADDAVLAAVAAAKVVIDDIHNTDLPAVKAETALIVEDTGTTIPALLETIDNFLDTEVAAILEDTGTTLPATLAAIAGYTDGIAGDVWSYAKRTLTHPSVSAEEPEDSNTLILYRDADIAIELTDLTIPAGAKKYIFTIKDNLDSGDDQAVLQASYAIDGSEVETNTLVYINSAAAPVLTNPVTFTLTDTNITIDLTAEAAALLPRYERGYLNWDLKLVTDASVTIVLQGLAQIIGTSTRAIE